MDKKLVISVDAKVSPAVQQMSRLLDDMATRGNKVAKAFAGVAPGAGPGAGPFKQGALAKALLSEKKLFDDLGKSGEKLAKILTEQVGKSQVTLAKQLEASTKGLDVLIKKHEFAAGRVEKLKREGADPSRIALAQSYAARAGHNVLTGTAEQQEAAAAVAGMSDGKGGITAGLGQGVMQAILARFGVSPGAAGAVGTAGGIVAAAAAGIAAGFKLATTAQKGTVSYEAAGGSILAQRMAYMDQANSQYAMGSQMMGQDPSTFRDLHAWSKLSHATGYLKTLPILLGGGGWDAYKRASELSGENAEKQMFDERRMELGERWADIGHVADIQKQDAKNRVRAGRRFGANATKRQSDMAATGWISRAGMDQGDIASIWEGLSGKTGAWGAQKHSYAVAAAIAAGMSPGQALGIVGAGAGTGSNLLGRSAGFDPTVRGIAGEAAAGTLGAGNTLFGGKGEALAGMLAASSTGSGALGVTQAQQAVVGAGTYGQLMGGHDPFQKSYNIAAASAALGGNADPYQRQFLASSMKDPAVLAAVLSAKSDADLPPQFRSMGISLAAAKAFAQDVDKGSTGSRFVDMGGNYEAATLMRQMHAAGGKQAWTKQMRAQGVDSKEVDRRIRAVSPLLAQVENALTGGEAGVAEDMLRFDVGAAGGAAPRRTKAGTGKGKPRAEEGLEEFIEAQNKRAAALRDDLNAVVLHAGEVKKSAEVISDTTKELKKKQLELQEAQREAAVPAGSGGW